MEGQLFYSVSATSTTKYYGNICRDLAAVNAKNEEHTTRDGHVKGYMCNIAILGGSGDVFGFTTAPNTWKMRNSFRKFHAYRELMFANAGVSKKERGRYGQTIRPYLNGGHLAEELLYDAGSGPGILVPSSATSAALGKTMQMGEWTYSQFATVPLYEEGQVMGDSTLTVTDEWPVTILDNNTVDTLEDKTSGTYSKVAMIHSYNLDRMDVVTPTTAGETIQGPANPLAALIASGNQAAGGIIDIAEDQELERPPYDELDDGDSTQGIRAQVLKTPTTLGIVRSNVFIPAGLFQLNAGTTAFDLYIDVIGTVLCKDLS